MIDMNELLFADETNNKSQIPIVVLAMDFDYGTTLSHLQFQSLLHEFGHSLHYLFDYKKMLFSN
jgi:Zn-dependent oligopeptidase